MKRVVCFVAAFAAVSVMATGFKLYLYKAVRLLPEAAGAVVITNTTGRDVYVVGFSQGGATPTVPNLSGVNIDSVTVLQNWTNSAQMSDVTFPSPIRLPNGSEMSLESANYFSDTAVYVTVYLALPSKD